VHLVSLFGDLRLEVVDWGIRVCVHFCSFFSASISIL